MDAKETAARKGQQADSPAPVCEVFRGGERVMWTTSPSCIPSAAEAARLKKDGHRVKVRI